MPTSTKEEAAIKPLSGRVQMTRKLYEIREGRTISFVRHIGGVASASGKDVMVVFLHGSMGALAQFRGQMNDS